MRIPLLLAAPQDRSARTKFRRWSNWVCLLSKGSHIKGALTHKTVVLDATM